jgi:hypothetical protein
MLLRLFVLMNENISVNFYHGYNDTLLTKLFLLITICFYKTSLRSIIHILGMNIAMLRNYIWLTDSDVSLL